MPKVEQTRVKYRGVISSYCDSLRPLAAREGCETVATCPNSQGMVNVPAGSVTQSILALPHTTLCVGVTFNPSGSCSQLALQLAWLNAVALLGFTRSPTADLANIVEECCLHSMRHCPD